MLDAMLARRSVRTYAEKPVSDTDLNAVLCAALSCPSSCNSKPWHLIVVKDRETLHTLTGARVGSAMMLDGAFCAIVSAVDKTASTAWIEDGSAALMNMHLAASALGLGSCWIQIRARETPDGQSSEEFVRGVLNIPENMGIVGLLSLGSIDAQPQPHTADELLTDRIHVERF
jgi:Nitroreductase